MLAYISRDGEFTDAGSFDYITFSVNESGQPIARLQNNEGTYIYNIGNMADGEWVLVIRETN